MSNERPDRRLRNWERWLDERRHVHHKLKERTGRTPGFLLMNVGENAAELAQKKTVVDGLEVPFEHDRYRGNPAFWTTPPALRKACDEPQTYYTTRTRRERCEKPEVEYVRVPKGVALEKQSLSNRTYNLGRSRYFLQRYGCEKAKLIEPYEPELDDLMLRGSAASLVEERLTISREDSMVVPSERSSRTSSNLDTPPPVPVMSLNELDLHDDAVGVKELRIFAYVDDPSSVTTLRLRIANRTSRVVRLRFVRLAPAKMFRDYVPSTRGAQHFFFDRAERIVAPGVRLDVPFWFRPGSHGRYVERLEVKFRPDRWVGRLRVEVELHGASIPSGLDVRCDRLLRELDDSTKAATAADILDEVVARMERRSPDVVVYKYDRELLFEAVNAAYDPFKIRPRYLYDKRIVDGLERLYEEARLERHPETWDYKLENLRTVCVDRDNFDRIAVLKEQLENWRLKVEESRAERKQLEAESEENRQIFGDGKKSTRGDKKHGSTSEEREKKKRTSYGRRSKAASMSQTDTWLRRYDELVARLEKPVAWKLARCKRMRVCYTLLCAHVDRIFAELDDGVELEWRFPKYPVLSVSIDERMYDERLEHCFGARPCLTEVTEGKPAPPWSETVPLEDYKKRFALAGQSPLLPNKVERTEKNSLLPSGSVDKVRRDPVPLESDGKYVVVYCMLQQFVDELTAVFELLAEHDVELAELSQMHRAEPLRPAQDFQVEIFDLKRTISELFKGDEDVTLEYRSVFVPRHQVKVEDSCTSVFTLLRSHHPKTLRIRPRTSGEVYVIEPHLGGYETTDNATAMAAEEIILERGVQTSICGDVAVSFDDHIEEPLKTCVCDEVDVVKEPEFDYYDSTTAFDVETPASSDEVESCSGKSARLKPEGNS